MKIDVLLLMTTALSDFLSNKSVWLQNLQSVGQMRGVIIYCPSDVNQIV